MRENDENTSEDASDGAALDGSTETYRRRFDPETDSPSLVAVSVVAAVRRTEPETLDPIYDVIDPDALDDLFGSNRSEARADGVVQFTYGGCRVSIHARGIVEATPISSD